MEQKDLLGGKGANLAEMTSVLKLPVPPGFTISTDACIAYLRDGWPAGLDDEIATQVARLEQQMGRQPVVADRGAVDQARRDHRPAYRPLQAAQHQQGDQPRLQSGRQGAAQPEPGERQRDGQADQTAPQAMQVLQPEDLFEFGDVEATIHQTALRRRKIFL